MPAGLDADVLGQAIYNARAPFVNKTRAELLQTYGTDDAIRLAASKAEAQAIIDHFTANAKLTVPGIGLTAPNGPVGGQSITGSLS